VPSDYSSFNNKNLADLSSSGSMTFKADHWNCTIKYDENNRLSIENIG
jgi:hypothetical protein